MYAMQQLKWVSTVAVVAAVGVVGAGCRSSGTGSKPIKETTPNAATQPTAAKPSASATAKVDGSPAAAAAPKSTALPTIRIDAGAEQTVTDKAGNVWAADTGFTGGDIVDRGDVEIAGTDAPEVYRTERFGMESFSQPVPNGSYTVKLHFAETYDGAAFEGGRMFTYAVEGHEVKDFDIYATAKKENTAVVKTHTVEVTDGRLDVTFTPVENNPAINAIEIVAGASR